MEAEQRNPAARRRSIIIGVLCAVLLGTIGAWLAWPAGGPGPLSPEQAARVEALEQARQRWEAQRPRRYRLVVRIENFGPCEQELLVEDEEVLFIERNSCGGQPIIQKAHSEGACQPKTVIQQDGVVGAESDPLCGQPAGAISDLFVEIAAVTHQQRCGPNGCQCDGVMVTDVIYDQQLGYPQRVREWVDPALRQPWPLMERIKGYLGQPSMACTMIGWSDTTTEIISLTPLE